jgi:hypothetical protein
MASAMGGLKAFTAENAGTQRSFELETVNSGHLSTLYSFFKIQARRASFSLQRGFPFL